MTAEKIVIAYSGGLDTSFCVKWYQDKGYEVHTATIDTGGFDSEELEEIAARAKQLGAASHLSIDAREAVFNRFGSYILKGNILRGGVYPLCVGAERVLQAEMICEYARKVGATHVAHGSTGAGNDQVRFDVGFRFFGPELTVHAPIRELALSRADEIEFLKKQGVELSAERKIYSVNQGVLGVTIGGGETHDSSKEIPEEAYVWTRGKPEKGIEPSVVEIGFAQGLPTSLNGETISSYAVLSKLNQIGSQYGYGRGIHLGDTILGIKGRLAFEAPGILALIDAHRELEKLVLTRAQLDLKASMGQLYGSLLHEARWFDPVSRDLEALLDSSQGRVQGVVKIRFAERTATVISVQSPFSLMHSSATYGEESGLWNSAEAAGFSKLYGVQSYLVSMTQSSQRDKADGK